MVTDTTQLSVFTTIRDLLLQNSTLNNKFSKSNFYLFEELLKNSKLPQIIIKVPPYDTELLTLDHSITWKTFSIPIIMKIGWTAKDKAVDYANAVINQIEQNEISLATNRIHNPKINLIDLDDDTEDQTRIVEAQFELTYNLDVRRS